MGLPFITQENPMKANPQTGLIKSWSNSTLDVFLECQWRIYLKKVLKLKVMLSEEKQAERDEAKDRGSDLHSTIEDYILGETDVLHKKIKHRREIITEYRRLYQETNKKVCIEEDWAFTAEWAETDWRASDVWNRTKIDAMFFESETSAVLDDWKSGKKYGNKGKHIRQLNAYVSAAFMKFPRLEHILARMQYIDLASDNTLVKNVSREEAMKYVPKLENQALAMTTCTTFRPCPNRHNCKFCEFAERKPNSTETYCEFAIKEL